MIVVGYNGFTRGAELFGRAFGATGIDRHRILGHDAAVAVMVDGELVAAAEEERFNREKKIFRFSGKCSELGLERGRCRSRRGRCVRLSHGSSRRP